MRGGLSESVLSVVLATGLLFDSTCTWIKKTSSDAACDNLNETSA